MPRSIYLIVLAGIALASCTRDATPATLSDAYRVTFGATGYAYISIFTDPVTGCDSYMTDDGFLSPRLRPDGTQMCRSVAPAPG
jgi:hypothetical protein